METPLTSTENKIETLRRCEFLCGLADSVLGNLAVKAQILRIPEGETIITKGDHGSTMYFIISGRVRVHAGDVIWAHIDEGGVFGEMAVLDSGVRSASVTTEQDSLLLGIDRDVFYAALSTDADAFKTVLHSVLQRERQIVDEIKNSTTKLLAYERELEIGRRIQANFLPEKIPEIENWEISAWFEAAREVSGDFYDVFRLNNSQHLAIVIGDVCDKGVGAALFMTLFRSLIRASTLYGCMGSTLDTDTTGSVREILINSVVTTNRYIATTHANSSMFASVFFGLLDPLSGELMYVNAGHEAPMIFRKNGETELLDITGGVLGLFGAANYGVETVTLNRGDLVFSYTDGINEAKNIDGDQFTEERIYASAVPGATDTSDFLATILNAVREFRGEALQSDDITMLALKYL